MLAIREKLPAYGMKDEIVSAIEHHQVVVISGDTGCGKTTQVPQLVLDALVTSGRGARANLLVTQPRRISAIGVSERMAAERAENVGETVGYSIRLESRRSSATRLLVCTTGVLLRRLQCDPRLELVSHVFVDEVHERDLNTDFLLIILRKLLSERKDLKLVLMSATLNAALFAGYFADAVGEGQVASVGSSVATKRERAKRAAELVPTVSIPGRTHPVQAYYLEDIFQITGHEIDPNGDYAIKTKGGGGAPGMVCFNCGKPGHMSREDCCWVGL